MAKSPFFLDKESAYKEVVGADESGGDNDSSPVFLTDVFEKGVSKKPSGGTDETIGKAFARPFRDYAPTFATEVAGGAALAADAAGIKSAQSAALDQYIQGKEYLNSQQQVSDSFSNIGEEGFSLAKWTAYTLGQFGSEVVGFLATEGVGTLTKFTLKGALTVASKNIDNLVAQKMAERLSRVEAERQAAQETAKSFGKQIADGLKESATSLNGVLNMTRSSGSIYGDLATEEGAQPMDGLDLLRIGVAGIASGALDSVMDAYNFKAFGKALTGNRSVNGVTRDILAGSLKEGFTESLQTSVEELFGKGKLPDAEYGKALIDSFAAGALGGAAFRGVANAYQKAAETDGEKRARDIDRENRNLQLNANSDLTEQQLMQMRADPARPFSTNTEFMRATAEEAASEMGSLVLRRILATGFNDGNGYVIPPGSEFIKETLQRAGVGSDADVSLSSLQAQNVDELIANERQYIAESFIPRVRQFAQLQLRPGETFGLDPNQQKIEDDKAAQEQAKQMAADRTSARDFLINKYREIVSGGQSEAEKRIALVELQDQMKDAFSPQEIATLIDIKNLSAPSLNDDSNADDRFTPPDDFYESLAPEEFGDISTSDDFDDIPPPEDFNDQVDTDENLGQNRIDDAEDPYNSQRRDQQAKSRFTQLLDEDALPEIANRIAYSFTSSGSLQQNVSGELKKIASEIGRLFNVRIEYIQDFSEDVPSGMAFADGLILINTASLDSSLGDRILLNVIGHEVFHVLAGRITPEQRSVLLKTMQGFMTTDGLSDLLKRKAAITSPNGVPEEVSADIFGSVFTTNEFWKQLTQREATIAQRLKALVNRIRKAIKALVAKGGVENRFDKILKNISDIDAATSFMADLANQGVENRKGQDYENSEKAAGIFGLEDKDSQESESKGLTIDDFYKNQPPIDYNTLEQDYPEYLFQQEELEDDYDELLAVDGWYEKIYKENGKKISDFRFTSLPDSLAQKHTQKRVKFSFKGGSLNQEPPSANIKKIASRVEKLFNVRIEFVTDESRGAYGGVAYGDGLILINTYPKYNLYGEKIVINVIGHEVFHVLAGRMTPEERKVLIETMQNFMSPEFAKRLGEDKLKNYLQEEVPEEISADIFGSVFTTSEFWKQLAQKDETIAQKLMGFVNRILETVKKLIVNFEDVDTRYDSVLKSISDIEAATAFMSDLANKSLKNKNGLDYDPITLYRYGNYWTEEINGESPAKGEKESFDDKLYQDTPSYKERAVFIKEARTVFYSAHAHNKSVFTKDERGWGRYKNPSVSTKKFRALQMHEIGGHYAVERMVGSKEYENLLQRMKAQKENDAEIQKAYASVPKNTPDHLIDHEAFAYLSENFMNKSFVQQFFQMVRDFIKKTFGQDITSSDLFLVTLSAFNTYSHEVREVFMREDIETKIPEGFEKLDFQKALDKNPEAHAFLDKIVGKFGDSICLSGSIAISPQMNIFRSKDELVHDLDFRVQDKETVKEILKFIAEEYPESAILNNFFSKKTGTLVHSLTLNAKQKNPVILDLFFNPKSAGFDTFEHTYRKKDGSQGKVLLAEANSIFDKKLSMGRAKDIRDAVNAGSYDISFSKEENAQVKDGFETDVKNFDDLPEYQPGQKTMTYAGVGSRKTPPEVMSRMTAVAEKLAGMGYTLQTGEADGADAAFRAGAKAKAKVFTADDSSKSKATWTIAREVHPAPERLSEYPLKLMARNTFQVFGSNLNNPVDFVLCWTPDGIEDDKDRTDKTGGTGQAISLASRKGIPVINMMKDDWEAKLDKVIADSKFERKPSKIMAKEKTEAEKRTDEERLKDRERLREAYAKLEEIAKIKSGYEYPAGGYFRGAYDGITVEGSEKAKTEEDYIRAVINDSAYFLTSKLGGSSVAGKRWETYKGIKAQAQLIEGNPPFSFGVNPNASGTPRIVVSFDTKAHTEDLTELHGALLAIVTKIREEKKVEPEIVLIPVKTAYNNLLAFLEQNSLHYYELNPVARPNGGFSLNTLSTLLNESIKKASRVERDDRLKKREEYERTSTLLKIAEKFSPSKELEVQALVAVKKVLSLNYQTFSAYEKHAAALKAMRYELRSLFFQVISKDKSAKKVMDKKNNKGDGKDEDDEDFGDSANKAKSLADVFYPERKTTGFIDDIDESDIDRRDAKLNPEVEDVMSRSSSFESRVSALNSKVYRAIQKASSFIQDADEDDEDSFDPERSIKQFKSESTRLSEKFTELYGEYIEKRANVMYANASKARTLVENVFDSWINRAKKDGIDITNLLDWKYQALSSIDNLVKVKDILDVDENIDDQIEETYPKEEDDKRRKENLLSMIKTLSTQKGFSFDDRQMRSEYVSVIARFVNDAIGEGLITGKEVIDVLNVAKKDVPVELFAEIGIPASVSLSRYVNTYSGRGNPVSEWIASIGQLRIPEKQFSTSMRTAFDNANIFTKPNTVSQKVSRAIYLDQKTQEVKFQDWAYKVVQKFGFTDSQIRGYAEYLWERANRGLIDRDGFLDLTRLDSQLFARFKLSELGQLTAQEKSKWLPVSSEVEAQKKSLESLKARVASFRGDFLKAQKDFLEAANGESTGSPYVDDFLQTKADNMIQFMESPARFLASEKLKQVYPKFKTASQRLEYAMNRYEEAKADLESKLFQQSLIPDRLAGIRTFYQDPQVEWLKSLFRAYGDAQGNKEAIAAIDRRIDSSEIEMLLKNRGVKSLAEMISQKQETRMTDSMRKELNKALKTAKESFMSDNQFDLYEAVKQAVESSGMPLKNADYYIEEYVDEIKFWQTDPSELTAEAIERQRNRALAQIKGAEDALEATTRHWRDMYNNKYRKPSVPVSIDISSIDTTGYDKSISTDLKKEIYKKGRLSRFIRLLSGQTRMAAAEIQELVSKTPFADRVTVLDNVSSLNPDQIEDIRKLTNGMMNARGYYDANTGRVYMFADHLPSLADAEFVLFHEIVGHYGLRSLVGSDLFKVLDDLYKDSPSVRSMADKNMADGMSRYEAIEEAFADIAGKNEPDTALQKFVRAVADLLRKIGFESVADYISGFEPEQRLSFYLRESKRAAIEDKNGYMAAQAPIESRLSRANLPSEMFASEGLKLKAYARYSPITKDWSVFERTVVKYTAPDGSTVTYDNVSTPLRTKDYLHAYKFMMSKGNVQARMPSRMWIDGRLMTDITQDLERLSNPFNDKKASKLEKAAFWLKRMVVEEYEPLYRVVRDLISKGRVSAADNVMMDLMLRERVVTAQIEFFNRHFGDPLVKGHQQLLSMNMTPEAINLYLVAKHARERNKRVAKISNNTNGSGMTNEMADFLVKFFTNPAAMKLPQPGQKTFTKEQLKARPLLDEIQNVYKIDLRDLQYNIRSNSGSVAKRLQEMSVVLRKVSTYKMLAEKQSGMVSAEEFANRMKYRNYVNLSGKAELEDNEYDSSTAMSPEYEMVSKRMTYASPLALGRYRGSIAPDVLARTITAAQASIIRAENNKVLLKLTKMVEENYDPKFIQINPVTINRILGKDGRVTYTVDENKIRKDGELIVRLNGKPNIISFTDKSDNGIFQALSGALYPSAPNVFLRSVRDTTNFLGRMMTTYNPWWAIKNISRDVETMYMNATIDARLGAEAGEEMLRSWGKAFQTVKAFVTLDDKEIWDAADKASRLDTDPPPGVDKELWKSLLEMKASGGYTNFLQRMSLEDQIDILNGKAADFTDNSPFQIKQKLKKIGEWAETWTLPSEGASRLAAYHIARKRGMTPREAAVLSGEITVNFNARGAGKMLRGLYIFFNPAVQSTRKIFELAQKNPKRFAMYVSGLVAMGAFSSMMQAGFAGGEDEEENPIPVALRMPSYLRETSLLLPGGFSIPLAYGYNAFYSMGMYLMDSVLYNIPMPQTLQKIAGTFLNYMTPSQVSELVKATGLLGDDPKSALAAGVQAVTPTLGLPLMQGITNQNRLGTPIFKEENPFVKGEQPDAYRNFAYAHPLSVGATRQINSVFGGNRYEVGVTMFDFNASFVDHLVTSYLPGIPAEAYKISGNLINAAKGLDTLPKGSYFNKEDNIIARGASAFSDDPLRYSRAAAAIIGIVTKPVTAGVSEGAEGQMHRKLSKEIYTQFNVYKNATPEKQQKMLEEQPNLLQAYAVMYSTDKMIKDYASIVGQIEKGEENDLFDSDMLVQWQNELKEQKRNAYRSSILKLMELGYEKEILKTR